MVIAGAGVMIGRYGADSGPAFVLDVCQFGAAGDGSAEPVRIFARVRGGATQLCAQLPSGVIKIIATE